jgi:hypothetical protein
MTDQPTTDHLIGLPNSYWLLGILQSHAPTGKEQAQLTDLYNQMRADGVDEVDLQEQLAGILLDGLRHGNWPWTDYKA